jgi:hypothetical protein
MEEKMKTSLFRIWLQNMWHEHKEEFFNYHGGAPTYDLNEYIRKHKWWLKEKYKSVYHNTV